MRYLTVDKMKDVYKKQAVSMTPGKLSFNGSDFQDLKDESERIAKLVTDWPHAERDLVALLRQIIMELVLSAENRVFPAQKQVLDMFRDMYEDHTSYITVTQCGSGFFAVMLWWNIEDAELGGFWEPWQTGLGRYKKREDAEREAKHWAEDEQLEFVS